MLSMDWRIPHNDEHPRSTSGIVLSEPFLDVSPDNVDGQYTIVYNNTAFEARFCMPFTS
jgi:hypothetical protein